MEMYDLRMVELALTMATQDETNAVAVRQLLWDRREQLVGSSKKTAEILQSHHVLLIAPSNIVRGWLIFPRNSGLLERLGGRMQRDEEFKQLKASEIHEEIERLKDILVPL